MTKVMLMVVLAATVAFGQQVGNASQVPKSQAKVLTRAEFDTLIAKPNQVLVIDVRRPDEVNDIGGFPVYLSIQIDELASRLAWIPRDRMIITVSNHAGRAGRAADILTKKGFKVAGAIGAQVYEQQGGRLTKIVPPPPNPQANAGNNAAEH